MRIIAFIVVISLSHKNNSVWSCWHALELVYTCVLVILIDIFGMFDIELLHHVSLWDWFWVCVDLLRMPYFVALDSKYISQFSNVYAITHLPGRFLFSDLLWDFWVELVIMEHSCIKFTFPTRLFHRSLQALSLVVLVVFDRLTNYHLCGAPLFQSYSKWFVCK